MNTLKIGLVVITLMLTACGESIEEKCERAQRFGDSEKYGKAIALLDEILQENPKYKEAYAHKASYLHAIPGREAEAFRVLNKGIELIPNCYICYFTRGVLGSGEKAITDLTIAIEGDKNDPVQYMVRGEKRTVQRHFIGAVEDFNKALELEPGLIKDETLLTNRGSCYLELEFYDKADKDIANLIKLFPEVHSGYFLKAMLLARSGGNVEEAKRYLKLSAERGLEDTLLQQAEEFMVNRG